MCSPFYVLVRLSSLIYFCEPLIINFAQWSQINSSLFLLSVFLGEAMVKLWTRVLFLVNRGSCRRCVSQFLFTEEILELQPAIRM